MHWLWNLNSFTGTTYYTLFMIFHIRYFWPHFLKNQWKLKIRFKIILVVLRVKSNFWKYTGNFISTQRILPYSTRIQMLSCHYEDFMAGFFTNPYLNGALKTYEKSVIVNNLIKLNTYNCSKTLWTDPIFCFQCNKGNWQSTTVFPRIVSAETMYSFLKVKNVEIFI